MSTTHDTRLKGMRWIAPGSFRMGSEDFYPEEAPVQSVHQLIGEQKLATIYDYGLNV